MNGKYLLDTNFIIGFLAGDPAARKLIDEADELSVSSIALGELFFGAYKSARDGLNISKINDFSSGVQVLDCDAQTARIYGRIKSDLRKTGRPIPENDIWVASTAMQHGLVLVSKDVHFKEIPNLKLEQW